MAHPLRRNPARERPDHAKKQGGIPRFPREPASQNQPISRKQEGQRHRVARCQGPPQGRARGQVRRQQSMDDPRHAGEEQRWGQRAEKCTQSVQRRRRPTCLRQLSQERIGVPPPEARKERAERFLPRGPCAKSRLCTKRKQRTQCHKQRHRVTGHCPCAVSRGCRAHVGNDLPRQSAFHHVAHSFRVAPPAHACHSGTDIRKRAAPALDATLLAVTPYAGATQAPRCPTPRAPGSSAPATGPDRSLRLGSWQSRSRESSDTCHRSRHNDRYRRRSVR